MDIVSGACEREGLGDRRLGVGVARGDWRAGQTDATTSSGAP
jgi:hypothetical protein